MGMDIYGRKNEAVCFCTSMWTWRVLHRLIRKANQRCRLGISAELLELMSYNEGAGLETQAECDCLADALDTLLPRYGEIISMKDLIGVFDKVYQWLAPTGFEDAYHISKEQVEEFIAFLRVCDGFCVR